MKTEFEIPDLFFATEENWPSSYAQRSIQNAAFSENYSKIHIIWILMAAMVMQYSANIKDTLSYMGIIISWMARYGH